MKPWCLVMIFALLSGCSASPDKQIQYYSLSLSSPTISQPLSLNRPVVRLMPVQLAPPLDQRNLQTQLGPHQIHAAHWHQWGSDPSRMLTQRLVAELTSAKAEFWIQDGSQQWPSNEAVPRLVVDVDRFQGDEAGNAVVKGQWRLYGAGNELLVWSRFNGTEPLSEPGYPALVAAMDSLLGQMAGSIALSLPEPPY